MLVLLWGLSSRNAGGNRPKKRANVGDDRVKAAAQQVKGSIKEAIGKINRAPKVEAEGAAKKATGDARSGIGQDHNKPPVPRNK